MSGIYNNVKYSILIIIALALGSGCVAVKSRQDQSKLAQFYHNTTAKYNGWFNANELLEMSIVKLEEQHQDNYNELLPLYEYAAVDNADAVKADLDEAIKKVSVVVTLHEYSDWSDDCYLLIGKSLYLQQDYEAAENAFEFYMDEFLPNGKRANIKGKKSKKSVSRAGKSSAAKEANRRKKELQKARKKAEKERKAYNKELRKRKKKGKPTDDLVRPGTTKAPDGTTTVPTPSDTKYDATPAELRAKAKEEGELSGIFLHEPVYDEAVMWLAKTYIERENWTAADYQLRRLEGDDVVPKAVHEGLPVVRAYYHIRRNNFPQVIPFLEVAIERAPRRQEKARYSYIIAQLHDRAGNHEQAGIYYQKALDYSNQYEMEFNTELSIIRSGVRNNTMSRAEALERLERMLKDDKNAESLGRIYYLMGTLELEAGNIPGAITYLELSVENIGNDPFQAIESQYLLAELYFQTFDYVNAEAAYKACAGVMKETDPRYKQVKKLAENLRDIAINLSNITLQDSLLMLSFKTEDELKEIARQIKKQQQQEAEEQAAKNKMNTGSGKGIPSAVAVSNQPGLAGSKGGSSGSGAIFWAFDPKGTKKTRREFDRVWGDISLTDYWRVSALATQYASTAESSSEPGQVAQVGLYQSEIEDIFKNVPKTDSARALSHNQIRKSMLLLGQLYRDRLDDFDNSIKVLESLLEKYPDAPEELEAYYQLYLSALSAGDHARVEKYKALILAEYPNSRFAKVLSDPNYAASQQSELKQLMDYYDETYALFEKGQHENVLQRIGDVEHKFGLNNVIMAKFDLLKAMSMGAQVGREAYIDGLNYVVSRYPNSDEEKKARDMLLLLGEGKPSKSYGETGLSSAEFEVNDNALHFVVIYEKNQDAIKLNDTKIAVAEFHGQFFKLDNLKMANLVFDPVKNHSLLLIRSFNTKDKAMAYYDSAKRNLQTFLPKGADVEVYPITQSNYREVIKSRTLETYKPFFEKHYLKK